MLASKADEKGDKMRIVIQGGYIDCNHMRSSACWNSGGRMASAIAEGGCVGAEWGRPYVRYGEECPLPSQLGKLGSV